MCRFKLQAESVARSDSIIPLSCLSPMDILTTLVQAVEKKKHSWKLTSSSDWLISGKKKKVLLSIFSAQLLYSYALKVFIV